MRIDFSSDNNAVVYGVKLISEYSDSKIELNYRNGKVIFEGENLICDYYMEGAVSVSGDIEYMRIIRNA